MNALPASPSGVHGNGPRMAELFRARWFPLAEVYFRGCAAAEKADLRL